MFTSQEEITSALCIEGTQCEAGKDDRGAQESSQDDAIKMNTIICHVLKNIMICSFIEPLSTVKDL